INGRDIKHNKPAPDIYLKGSEMLGVAPADCLVIEDAENGILAAKAAGMHQCAVTTTFFGKGTVRNGRSRVHNRRSVRHNRPYP
ncbi:MAG: HAD family phosphatase, partial [Clostridia bacterium]|nr:HAD family phosphatase [Clostridia bacterium]